MRAGARVKEVGKTFIYVISHPNQIRFFPKWVYSMFGRLFGKKPLERGIPWITFEAKNWLENYLKPNMVVFEYGSGGSTLFIVRRVKKLTSVEHDRAWYGFVRNKLNKEKLSSNCQYVLKEPKEDKSNDLSFSEYVAVIDKFEDNFFDLVSIDGRSRVNCIKHTMRKVKPGGFIMLDTAERERYNEGKKLLKDWKQTNFRGLGPCTILYWDTTIWQKIK